MNEVIERIEKYALSKDSKPQSLFAKVGIVGCGETGRSIARMVSVQGIDVVFIEHSQKKINDSLLELSKDLDNMIDRWGMTVGEKRAILSRIKGSVNYKSLKGCSLVIESILSSKREHVVDERKEIFKNIEKNVDNDTIIATNSTTLVITELSSELEHPERCVSFHFISPAPDAKVVEVVKSLHTSEEAFSKVSKFAKLLDKKLISVTESPGIISVRLIVPLINEACEIFMEGVGTMEDIDNTMKLGYGLPLGPFELADKIGLDKLLRWCENLYKEFGDLKYKASPFIKKKVRANHLGRKVKNGFYKYDESGKKIRNIRI